MRRPGGRILFSFLLAVLAWVPVESMGQAPSPLDIALEPVLTGLDQPLFLTHAGDGTGRRFVLEQPGRILVLAEDATSPGVFLDIRDRVRSGGEQGLLGLAFHPDFSANRRFFVNYTRDADGATVIAEYEVSAADPDIALRDESVLLAIAQPFANHNGGMIAFGPDGFLYAGVGDGGAGNDPGNRAQDLSTLLGKILRIDVNRRGGGTPYSSPESNPFVGREGRDEIYAWGLRNPWRFAFDRTRGTLYAGDVGQNAVEEIDVITAGGNYGWRVFEGSRCTGLDPAACQTGGFIGPAAEYANTGFSGRCSVTGGFVYRGARHSLPQGAYVFGDFCSGEIFILQNGLVSLLEDTDLSLASFGEDEAAELYAVDLNGAVFKIVNPAAAAFEFIIPPGGGVSRTTSADTPAAAVGYARVDVDDGRAPAGVAVLGFAPDAEIVSEAGLEAMAPILSGRVAVEMDGPVNTGVAVVNPNAAAATVSFSFTDLAGTDFRSGAFHVPAGAHIARFLDQEPFLLEPGRAATLTFHASMPVGVAALRGFVNERFEFLMAPVPVAPLAAADPEQVIAHFAAGGGWTSEIVLINPSDEARTGRVDFLGPDGGPAAVSVNGQVGSTVLYAIPPRSAVHLPASGSDDNEIRTGSVRITASDEVGPAACALLVFRREGVVVTTAGIGASGSADAFRLFVEGDQALSTGVAIANRSRTPVSVDLELRTLDGRATGRTNRFALPSGGQMAGFIREFPGFESLGLPYQGILRVSGSAPVAVAGLRGRTNGRGDFLVAAIPPIVETPGVVSRRIFPHFADGGGYRTEFILIGRSETDGPSGVLRWFAPDGEPTGLDLR